ncbi:MAG: enoyl-CoA hydratase-related protein [Proteobacteria bacterium]|nr:enoyl-CoA hydratase-related protein [Pseudomonadota bacterium]
MTEILTIEDQIATIRFNRPQAMNAMNSEVSEAVIEATRRIDNCRALIVTGNDKAFSAGADLKEDRPPESRRPRPIDAIAAIAAVQIPVFAAIEGYCIAGGLEVALACDFLIGSETSRFSLAEVKRGFIPGGGGTQRLPRRIGTGRAKEMLFFGNQIDAATAHAWGLINRLVPTGSAYSVARDMAMELAKGAPLAIRELKRQVDNGMEMPLDQAMLLERDGNVRLDKTVDAWEGRLAFREKRTPVFKGI